MPARRDAPLVVTALAYTLCHHLGSLPDGLGDAGRGTRIADWLDLVVPFVVLLPALGTLLEARVGRATYLWFAVGSWLYATGHGIHLAANSIGNVAPGETAHLWDEQVGHWTWYAGVAVVAATLASTLVDRPVPTNPLAWVLALAVGATWGTNATGGEFTWPGLALAVVAIWWGVRHRRDRGVLLVAVGAAGVVGVVASAVVR
ncbi:MAG TPA: hypothetical protein PLZ93_17205 [Nocardioides sp.]|uniref:hypothetical protein n=1 Tax=uncultured Nocardioides sp. TaxID=198441 RepID=UPI000ED49FDB|nr:hypothetical protein [uncultured Nocardioides sp.]HCB07951.1 hypothetical protein [Nocardioides sp.]HRD63241.1 hypothetical protein [Nocardioides sp.]HRI97359.1 hypothetical protein [Nocardioides sp.]HRK48793.1 hypothetical protein [Nocardioides sp.]